jgi:hypothetical protein
VADEPASGTPTLELDTRMDSPAARRGLAQRTLELADTLRR